MMPKYQKISRRDFLHLASVGFGALLIPNNLNFLAFLKKDWPTFRLNSIPSNVQEILTLVPDTIVGNDGTLFLMGSKEHLAGRIPLVQTQWNKENSFRSDRLYSSEPWGIVLHWFGEKENFDHTVSGYLRGFNSLRKIDNYETKTSAHFLVGKAKPTIDVDASESSIGILQTQKPAKNGAPYVASHISGLDYNAHKNRKHYFVRAYYQLGFEEPGVHSILQDWFDAGRSIDPNMRTFAIEMTGYDFEDHNQFPSNQQIANVISVIWAIMRRYGITANNIFGHNEIQLNKSDPGKKFMGMIRYLIGIKALLDDDPLMNQLVFGNFLYDGSDAAQAVQKYFKFVYDYLLIVSRPINVYEWEGRTGYWFLRDLVDGRSSPTIGRRFLAPLAGKYSSPGRLFTRPANHEGIDLYRDEDSFANIKQPDQALLVTHGKCIHIGELKGCNGGQVVIFRHRQMSGSQVLSVYGHLEKLNDLSIGTEYPIHYPIGEMINDHSHTDPFLHFAMAYGGTWDTDLKERTYIPLNVGASWIKSRYMNPLNLMSGGFSPRSRVH
jgi:hypothetical protein